MRKYSTVTLVLILLSAHLSAMSGADSLRLSLNYAENLNEKVETAIRLSRELNRNKAEKDSALFYARRAVDWAATGSDTLLMANSLDNLGLLYRYNQLYAQSIPLHRKAYELTQARSDRKRYLMRFANNAAVAARYNQDHALAVEYYLNALRLAEEENDLRNIAIASNGLGNSLSYINPDSPEATQHFTRALEVEEVRGNPRGMAMNLLSMASYHTRQKEHRQAQHLLERLLTINQQINDGHGLAITYEYFGHNAASEGRHNRARDYYLQALKGFEAENNRLKMSDLLQHLGQTAEALNQTGRAEQYYRQALELAEEGQHKALIAGTAERLSRLFEKQNNYARALHYNKISEAYKDSLDVLQQQSVMEGLQMQYNFEQKENEIMLLRAQQETREAAFSAQQERFKRERNFYVALLLILLTSTTVVVLILRNLNLKKNIRLTREAHRHEQVQQEFQRNLWQAEILATRLQMNPHFLFNCLNSIKYLIQKEQQREAIKYLTTLSKFMRELLETGKQQSVALEQELELAQKYVTLEALRFDQDLDFAVHTPEALKDRLTDIQLPPMVLQPFLENAIWHGLIPSTKAQKVLHIELQQHQQELRISISDNGVGRSRKPQTPTKGHRSMGLQITRDRIALYNKMTHNTLRTQTIDLVDEQQQAAGTRVELSINLPAS